MTTLTRTSSSCKRQNRPLLREDAPHEQTYNCLRVRSNLLLGSRCGLTPRQTLQLTVGRSITLILIRNLSFTWIEVRGQLHFPAAFSLLKGPSIHIRYEGVWNVNLSGGCGKEKNLYLLQGNDSN
jgi:hypothetical protein